MNKFILTSGTIILFLLVGITFAIFGFIKQTTVINGNYFLFGIVALLLSLHLLNSRDIEKLEKQIKEMEDE